MRYFAELKYGSLIFLLLCLGCGLSNPDKPRKKPKTVQLETPPGTVWLRDNLFIDQHEIANLDYMEFLWWLSRKDTASYQRMLPDTLVWLDTACFNQPFVSYYLRDVAYADYPVVGISPEQAISYCNWRSDRVNEMMYVREHKIKYDLRTVYPFEKRVMYRLPSREEWEYAAQAGLSYHTYPLGYINLYEKDSVPVSNICTVSDTVLSFPMSVQGYRKNRYNLYHMLGNVSELSSDGYIKGLNFLSTMEGSSPFLSDIKYIREPDSLHIAYTIKSYMKYKKPAAWLGFRCVCEMLK